MAVKLLHEPFATSREPVARLYREARAAGTIGHPNIIQIFDVGETQDGSPFLVMELLKGESLGEHLEKHGPRPLGFALDVGIQMLSALHAAHTSGIIHRDLKSDNVFLLKTENDDDVQTKLLDFGISKFVESEQEWLKLTQTGSVLGTPYYMSPEQASGKKDLDQRLDIYAAGVILYELFTGNVPHRATNYNALLMEIITNDVQPFAWQRPDLPKTLEETVLKALSRNRQHRWQRALDFMEALREIRDQLSGEQLRGEASVVRERQGQSGHRISRDAETIDVGAMPKGEEPDTPFAVESRDLEPEALSPGMTGQRRRVAWGGAVVGLLAVIGVIFFVSVGRHDPDRAAVPQTGAASAEKEAETAETKGQAARGAAISKPIRLQVQKTPSHAVVKVDGRPIPVDGIDLPKGSAPLLLVAEADGFETRKQEIIPSEDIHIEMKLTPLVTRKSRASASRRAKRRRAKKIRDVATPKSSVKTEPEMGQVRPKSKPVSLERPMDNPF